MDDSKKKVSELLKEQLGELCEVNSKLLKKSKEIRLDEVEVKTLEIVNNSIHKIGVLFKSDNVRW